MNLTQRSFAIVLTLASGIALSAAAQTAPAPATEPQPGKIAIIAFRESVTVTNEGQRDFAALKGQFEPRSLRLKALSDEIDSLTKQLQAQGAQLSPADQQSRTAAIAAKKKQLSRDAQEAQTDFSQASQKIYSDLGGKVYQVMLSYAKAHGYTLVLDVGEQQSPVLYATQDANITKAIVEAYNAESGIAAPPAEPSSANHAAKPATTH